MSETDVPLSCQQAADLLLSLTSQIIEKWEKRCRQDVPAAKNVARPSLVNSLPNFLKQMANTLCSPESISQAESNAEVACEHGEERARLGNYTLNEVIHEYQVLREVVVRYLETELPLAPTTQEVIHAFIDLGIRKAAARYSDLARKELALSNDELQKRNLELIDLNNDVTNLIESVSIPVIIVGLDLCVRRFTPAAKLAFNLAPSDLGRELGDIQTNFDIPDFLYLITNVIETSQIHQREVRDRKGHWFSMIVRPYHTSQQKLEGAVITLFDIDIIHRAVENLLKINLELEQFAYIASHDLQEPLRQVAVYLDLLSKRHSQSLNEEAREFIEIGIRSAKRMKALIDDLLTFSSTGREDLKYEPTDCSQIVDKMIASLKPLLPEVCTEITRSALPTISANDSLIGQVFQNLIDNAVKFRGIKPPVVHISATEKKSEWEFKVKDNGIGIDKEYADRIFMIYQRLHGPEEYAGTGIGLAICKKIIERYDGRIWMESIPGAGSSFFFTIPKR